MSDFFDIPTLVIIGVAIFVLMRLRSVLGTRTGNERSNRERDAAKRKMGKSQNANNDDVVVPLHPNLTDDPENEAAGRASRKFEAEMERWVPKDKDMRANLIAISQVDESFSPKNFLDAAGSAYEMIVTAYAAGDKSTLKNLLDKDVFDGFESAIDEREKNGHRVDFTFVGLPNIEYLSADLDKKVASITLRLDAEVVSATLDSDDNVIEGHEEQVVNLADEWTFSRNTKSRDPNWKLVATDQIS